MLKKVINAKTKGKPVTKDTDSIILELFEKLTDQLVSIRQLDQQVQEVMTCNAMMAEILVTALTNLNNPKENQ